MSQRPAGAGWRWVKEGLGLFRKQPGELSSLQLGYMLGLMVISIVPFIGSVIAQLLSFVLMPMLSVAFMRACAHIDYGRRAMPTLLLSGWRSPARQRLFGLGGVQLLVLAFSVAIFALVDDGTFVKVLQQEVPRDAIVNSNFGTSSLVFGFVYGACSILLAFAPALVYWQGMAVGKAIFYSVFAVLRSLPAFIVMLLSWMGILILPTMLILNIAGQSPWAMIIISPLILIVTIAAQCAFYASYRDMFGLPEVESEPDSPKI